MLESIASLLVRVLNKVERADVGWIVELDERKRGENGGQLREKRETEERGRSTRRKCFVLQTHEIGILGLFCSPSVDQDPDRSRNGRHLPREVHSVDLEIRSSRGGRGGRGGREEEAKRKAKMISQK